MNNEIKNILAPSGILKIAVNMSNFLLVSSVNLQGVPQGISPDLGKKIAEVLGLDYEFILYQTPGELADDVNTNKWDIGNIAFQPKRSKTIDFSNPYVTIEANFLVKNNSHFKVNNDFDKPNVKIIVFKRSAYDLWLTDNFYNVEMIRVNSIQESHDFFKKENNENFVLASLKPKLLEEVSENKNYRLIEKPFASIKQCVGIKKNNPKIINFLNDLIEELIITGYVSRSLNNHNVENKLSIFKV